MKEKTPLDKRINRIIKRTFDVLFSTAALIGLLPLFPVIALKIKIQSRGPVFFSQKRTGKDGKDFVCYKFRSMHINQDAHLVQATKNDPRTFPFGAFIRKHNIDELPQFWNVLKGDMSVVGPRPHMLRHTEIYSQQINNYMQRHVVKPGVTGWAQVTGYCGETKELADMRERVRRDLWYIEHWSLFYDIRIIWTTAKNILSQKIMTY